MSDNTARFGSLVIDGHSYPSDPSSDAFTDLLMDCFQRGRDTVAARQRQSSAASPLTVIKTKPVTRSRVKSSPRIAKAVLLKKKKANHKLKHA